MKLAAGKQRQTHLVRNDGTVKWIEEYVERRTSGTTKRAEDAQAADQSEEEDMNRTRD
jgi:hypothetical protein